MNNIEQKALELVNEVLDYNPESGDLVWKKRDASMFKSKRDCDAWNTRYAGKKISYVDPHGYLILRINGKPYKAHRIAYAISHGEWPTNQIDHINGVKTDNRISNLRHVTGIENARNTKRHSTNTSGMSGVYWNKRDRLWNVRIGDASKPGSFVGTFKSFDDAVEARKRAEADRGYHENHGRTAVNV